MNKKYRLRYAPSPTGYLHIGNTRTALMNYLFAKHYDGSFIVRIEDTDLERNVDGAIESQFDNLNWLGITPDESFLNPGDKVFGAYKQSDKFKHYEVIANQLINSKQAYRCFCTTEELEKDYEDQTKQGIVATKYSGKCKNLSNEEIQKNILSKKSFSVRFIVGEKILKINDFIKGEISFDSKELGDFVILKSNSIATYNFAVVVDDHDMQITHVLRGEEHISNTPRQILIYEALGWSIPLFGHMSLIVDSTGKKLSKRSGNQLFFIEQYKKQGYLPEAMFNYISLLGWSPGGEREIFSKDDLINIFDDKRFSKSPSTFDPNKMLWINSQYMKKINDEEYLKFIRPFIDETKWPISNRESSWVDQVLLLFKKEIEYAEQINKHLDLFFDDLKIDDHTKETLNDCLNWSIVVDNFEKEILNLTDWSIDTIKNIIKNVGVVSSVKGKDLFMPIRIAATCKEHGPNLADVIFLIGKEWVLKNVKKVK